MTEANRRDAIVRMATDPQFAERVHTDPASVAAEYGLTPGDLTMLTALRDGADQPGAAVLDDRLSKSSLFFGGAAGLVAHNAAHAGLQCNGHAGLQCNGHAGVLLCNGHAGVLKCNGHAGLLKCDGFAPELPEPELP